MENLVEGSSPAIVILKKPIGKKTLYAGIYEGINSDDRLILRKEHDVVTVEIHVPLIEKVMGVGKAAPKKERKKKGSKKTIEPGSGEGKTWYRPPRKK